MSKIIGATVGTTLPKPNWEQKDPAKGDYIKNKPCVVTYTEQSLTDEQKARARKNIGITGTGKDGTDGYTPVKGVDYFDGKDGYTPVKGKDYFDGEDGRNGMDGYTPVKGVDYFDGKDGADGKDGSPGSPGKDGTSVTITEITESDASGGENVVTFSDGEALTVKNGKDGEDGYTPVRGTDYWTDADKSEIKSYVDEAILGGAW